MKATKEQIARWRRDHDIAVRQLTELRLAHTALVQSYERMRDALSACTETVRQLQSAAREITKLTVGGAADGNGNRREMGER